jgi:hypothetical protein
MKATYRKFNRVEGGTYRVELVENLSDIELKEPGFISIDCSSTNTGITFMSRSARIYGTASYKRSYKETAVEYKLKLKEELEIMLKNHLIGDTWYEAPVIGHASAVPALYMLASTVDEIKIEQKYGFTPHVISNSTWKKLLFQLGEGRFGSEKYSKDTEKVKKEIQERVSLILGISVEDISEDEFDSVGMALVVSNYEDKRQLDQSKKPTKFAFNAEFYYSDSEEEFLNEVVDDDFIKRLPKGVVKNVTIVDVSGRQDVEKRIYKAMVGEDSIYVFKFPSNSHGDIQLKYKVKADRFERKWLFMVVTRKNRIK